MSGSRNNKTELPKDSQGKQLTKSFDLGVTSNDAYSLKQGSSMYIPKDDDESEVSLSKFTRNENFLRYSSKLI